MNREITAGAIISGTVLNRDLIPAFATELHRVTESGFRAWASIKAPGWLKDVVLRKNSELLPAPDHVWWHTAHANQLRDSLIQHLEQCAPFGLRFGEFQASESDGVAWGWWPTKDVGADPLEGGGTFRREPTCVECGANHIIGVANVEWDLEGQTWKITELVGEYRCVACDHEASQVEWEHADKGLGEEELAERYGEKGHPEHTRKAWKTAIHVDETDLGYWSWVYDKLDN